MRASCLKSCPQGLSQPAHPSPCARGTRPQRPHPSPNPGACLVVTGVLGSEGVGMREDPVPFSPCSPLLEGCGIGRLPIQSLPPVAVLLFRTKLTIRILEHKSWFRTVLWPGSRPLFILTEPPDHQPGLPDQSQESRTHVGAHLLKSSQGPAAPWLQGGPPSGWSL